MNFYTFVGRHREDILVRRVVNGERVTERIPYKPKLYVPLPAGTPDEGFRTLQENPMMELTFDTLTGARDFIEQQREVDPSGSVYGNTNYPYVWISENYPDHIQYDMSKFRIVNMDIETASENGFSTVDDVTEKVTAITIKVFGEDNFVVFGVKDYTPLENEEYHQYDNEKDMLMGFIEYWSADYPDILTGWNTSEYDVPYLYNRISKLFNKKTANRLSPFNYVRKTTKKRFDEEKTVYLLVGINDLDYNQIYRKNVLEPLESYTLDFIAEYELGENKLDYTEYRNLWEMYLKDHQKFIEYNIHDVRLVEMIEQKRRLIELQLLIAFHCKVNPEDVISQVRTWDAAIFNHLIEKKIVVPMVDSEEKDDQYEGAFVKIPEAGIYKWVASFDIASLYPSLIAALNIGVETKQNTALLDFPGRSIVKSVSVASWLDANKPDWSVLPNYTLAANRAMYSKDKQSIYTTMIVDLLQRRKEYRARAGKAEKLVDAIKTEIAANGETPELKSRLHDAEYELADFDLKQKSIKVLNNSLYGCVGNEYFRFYDVENAEAITVTGRFVIQHIAKGLNKFLNGKLGTENYEYVFYIDTDSNYVVLDNFVKKYLPDETDIYKIAKWVDNVCKKIIEAEINRLFEEIVTEYLNGMPGFLSMKREVIADQGIWTSKKRYAMRVLDSEGKIKNPPDLKFMGLEMKRSTTPKVCKKALIDCCRLIFDGDQNGLYKYIEDFYNGFFALDVEEISAPTGVKNLEKYGDPTSIYLKGCPIHVRAALMYNHMLVHHGLDKVYTPIRSRDKIKFVYLKNVNPTNQNVMAVVRGFPKEFGLEKYVDYETQYHKKFFEPMLRIAEAAGFQLIRRANIESLFE